MKALVTGGAGFIGSALVDRLLAEGNEVDVIDDLSTGSLANLADARSRHVGGLRFHRSDVRHPAVVDLVKKARPEVVFHLAAQADVRVSVADPVLDAEVNLVGTLRVCQGALAAGAEKVVFAGSGGTLYGMPTALPVAETYPHRPISPYGLSKMAAGEYLRYYAEAHDLDTTVLALANVYGPRQDPHGEAGVVAIFAGRLLAGDPCVVYGDGNQTRDFVYVDDVVDAFMRAAGAASVALGNVGTGTETSVNQLHSLMSDLVGNARPALPAPARVGELARSALDPSYLGRALGWKPSVSLEEGLRRTLDWFRQRR